MNILFHMFLSGADDELLAGNFMGDFVKGPLNDHYPSRIRQGLVLHRRIDSFAQRDESFQSSRRRISAEFGLFRGILVDLFYDHFLASEWEKWSRQSLTDYLVDSRRTLETFRHIMPEELQNFFPVIFDELLPSYHQTSGISAALERMSRRVRRPNPLAGGGRELTRLYRPLHSDFTTFMISVQRFVAVQVRENTL